MEVVDLQGTRLVELEEKEVTVVQGLVQMEATEAAKMERMESMEEAPVRDPKSVCGHNPVSSNLHQLTIFIFHDLQKKRTPIVLLKWLLRQVTVVLQLSQHDLKFRK